MGKEQLEKAKKILNHIKGYGVYDGNDDIEIFEWLIQQAERVQELENVNRVLKKSNVGSERAKERLREWIDELEIENERYRAALEEIITLEEYNNMPNFWHDEGDFYDYLENLARKALEEEEK